MKAKNRSILSMKAMLAIAFLSLTACAPKPPEYTEVESSLSPYFTAFKTEADTRGESLNISRFKLNFDASLTSTNHAGKCYIGNVQTGTPLFPGNVTELVVSINPQIFEQTTEVGRIELVFHELGHCLLGHTHNDSQIPMLTSKGVILMPASWMSTYHFSEKLTEDDQALLANYYINQIFDPEIQHEDLSQPGRLANYKIHFSKLSLAK